MKKILSAITVVCIVLSVFTPFSTVYADNWILASQLPQGTDVVSRKWTYTQTYYTTSSSSSLSGWEKYKTTWEWGPWGSWSSWTDSKKTASDSRQIKTRTMYNYYRWAKSYNASTGSQHETSVNTTKYKYKITDELKETSSGSGKYKLYHDKNGDYDKNGTSYHSVWKRTDFKTTQYKYRDRSKVYTYYYKKSENKESTSYPSGDNISNIQEWVTYKYKTFTLDLNGMLDNSYSSGISNFGTADIYINGVQVANDVTDFYQTYSYGTSYEIKDIKPLTGHSYDGINSGNLSGTITDNISVVLKFHTNSYIRNVISEDETKGTVTGGGTYLYGTNAEIKAFPKQGYIFSQWSNGSTSSAITITVTGNATYTAYFSPQKYQVTFDPNTGTVDVTDKTITYNELYGELPIPQKNGYKFDGWFTAVTGGIKIDASTKVSTLSNQTLYAQWSEVAHNFSEWIVDKKPSCTEVGLQHRTCIDCGTVEQTEVATTEHTYSEKFVVVEIPTCTKEGKQAYVCSICGAQKEVSLIEKSEHAYGEWNIKENASCVKAGKKQRVCSTCSMEDTADIPPTGHNYSEEWKIVTSPTCTKEGEKARICSECGDEIDNKPVEKSEHSYGDWILMLEADCTESGFEYRTCKICGLPKSRRIKALGHQYDDNWTILKEATCTSTGEKVHTCSLCGNTSDVTIIERKEHNYGNWITEKVATCTEDGLETRQCSICNKKEEKIIGSTGHNFIVSEVTQEPDPILNQPGKRIMICKNGCDESFTEEFRPEIKAGNLVTSFVGELSDNKIKVLVKMTDNPGFSNCAISLNYDKSVFTPQSIKIGDTLNKDLFDSNLIAVENEKVDLDEIQNITIQYGDRYSPTDITDEEVELCEITFEVNTEVPSGEYTITTSYTGTNGFVSSDGISASLGIWDSKFNQIIPETINATYKLENIRGDVNQDHKVDILDRIYLAYKMVNWEGLPWSDMHQQAADVFADGRLTPKDGTRLAQLISGYDAITPMSVNDVDISLFSTDKDYINLYVGNVTGIAGTEIDVPIVIKGNVGLSGFNFRVNYDNKYLTPISVINGSVYDGNCTTNLQQENLDISSLSCVNVCWLNDSNIYGEGVLFTVRFMINKNVTNGQVIPITLGYDDGAVCRMNNSTIEDVDIIVKQGSVETAIDESVFAFPYEITEVIMSESDGTELNNIPKNEDFIVSVKLSKLKTCSDTAQIYIAEYDNIDKLINVSIKDVTEKMINGDFCDINIETTNSEISYIKLFVWNEDMMPLAESYMIK